MHLINLTFTLVSGWQQSILQYQFEGDACCGEETAAKPKGF
jgi:hypothetical protein